MNLYLLTQNVNTGYDTYDSAIVAAKDEDSARKINPSEFSKFGGYNAWDWAISPEQVTVKLIGKATKGTLEGVILASFNAG